MFACCCCHILFLSIFSQSLGFIYIFLLAGLVAAVEQEDNFVLLDCVMALLAVAADFFIFKNFI